MSKGRWKVKLKVEPCLRALCLRAVLGLSAFLAVSVAEGPVRADDGGGSQAPDDIASCVSASDALIPVARESGVGVFSAENGKRYFASDLRYGSTQQAGASEEAAAYPGAGEQLAAMPLGPADRWGQIPAWIVVRTGNGSKLYQAELLRQGRAVFAPGRSSGACAGLLRRAEDAARYSGLGLWRADAPPVVFSAAMPKALESMAGHYVIARGRVESLGKTRTTRYLNFGKHWKTDFTVTLKTSEEDIFNAALGRSGWQVDALTGQAVEFRGTVQTKDGPHIALHHPEQLVVLERPHSTVGNRN